MNFFSNNTLIFCLLLAVFTFPGMTSARSNGYFRDFPIIHLEGDRIAYDLESRIVVGENGVSVRAGGLHLFADKITLYIRDWTLTALGNITLVSGDKHLHADLIQIHFSENTVCRISVSAATDIRCYSFPELNDLANASSINEKQLALYSAVASKPAYLTAQSLIFHPDLKVRAIRARFIADGLQAFSVPWIVFSLDKSKLKRGFLWHSLNYSSVISGNMEYRYYLTENIQGTLWFQGEHRLDKDRYDTDQFGELRLEGTLFKSDTFTARHDFRYDTDERYNFELFTRLLHQEHTTSFDAGIHRYHVGDTTQWLRFRHDYSVGNLGLNFNAEQRFQEMFNSVLSLRYQFPENFNVGLQTTYYNRYLQNRERRQEYTAQRLNIDWSIAGIRIAPGMDYRHYFSEDRQSFSPFLRLSSDNFNLGITPFKTNFFCEFVYFNEYNEDTFSTWNTTAQINLLLDSIRISDHVSLGYTVSPCITTAQNRPGTLRNDINVFMNVKTSDRFYMRTGYWYRSRWNMASPGWTEGHSESTITMTFGLQIFENADIRNTCHLHSGNFEPESNETHVDIRLGDFRIWLEYYYDFVSRETVDAVISVSKLYTFLNFRMAYHYERNDLRLEVTSTIF
jgi:hypothetical protein